MQDLLAHVRAVLRRTPVATVTLIAFGGGVVDLARRVVSKHGTEVHLTPAGFDLLRVLGKDLDRVLAHRRLLGRAWGTYGAENSQQLRVVSIDHLRRELDDEPVRPRWIVAEPGAGYRLRSTPTEGFAEVAKRSSCSSTRRSAAGVSSAAGPSWIGCCIHWDPSMTAS